MELYHNSTNISIELSVVTGSQDISVRPEGVALLYTVSVNKADTVYELKTNFRGGILPLSASGRSEGSRSEDSSSSWKTTRVMFLMPTNKMVIGFLGFHIDPDSWSVAFNGQNAVVNGVEPTSRPGVVEVITDSIHGFSIAEGKTRSMAEVASQAVLHWAWRLGEIFAADRRIMRVDGENLTSRLSDISTKVSQVSALWPDVWGQSIQL